MDDIKLNSLKEQYEWVVQIHLMVEQFSSNLIDLLYGFYAYTNLTSACQMKSKGPRGIGGAARIFSSQHLVGVFWWVFIKGEVDGFGVSFNRFLERNC